MNWGSILGAVLGAAIAWIENWTGDKVSPYDVANNAANYIKANEARQAAAKTANKTAQEDGLT